jgi:hypothetical protein
MTIKDQSQQVLTFETRGYEVETHHIKGISEKQQSKILNKNCLVLRLKKNSLKKRNEKKNTKMPLEVRKWQRQKQP